MAKKDEHLTAIAKATDEFLDAVRLRSSEPAAKIIGEFASRYPEIKTSIQDLFPALVGMEQIANNLDSPSQFVAPREYPELQDYEVIGEIGRGGMGVVYEARQISLDRKVALKTLKVILSLQISPNACFSDSLGFVGNAIFRSTEIP